jgi:hypothetical protein
LARASAAPKHNFSFSSESYPTKLEYTHHMPDGFWDEEIHHARICPKITVHIHGIKQPKWERSS